MVTNSEVWMGSGASVTLVPESDLFLGYRAAGLDDTVDQFGGSASLSAASGDATKGSFFLDTDDFKSQTSGSGVTFKSKYLLVEDLYTGCIADFYDSSNNLILSRVISGNDSERIYFNETFKSSSLAANSYVVIRKFGTPVVGPIRADASSSTSQPTLLADNWMGIVNTITFPNPEIEILQKNLALGGSRNFTFQFKGMENAAGGAFEVSANQGTWLYYALGKCTNVNATFTDTSELTDNFVGADDSNDFLLDSGSTGNNTAFLEQGPIFYRKIGTTVCPPITKGDMTTSGTQHHMEKLTEPTESSGTIANAITYTFAEANGSELPSFTLEHVIEKGSPTESLLSDGSDQTYSTTANDGTTTTLRVSDEVFSRIATGNVVNTLTLMANEGEELKMSMDLMTKQIVRPQSNDTTSAAASAYFARRGVTDERDFINFGSAAGGANNSVEGFLKPFFFHDGSLSIFGQQFLKITNFTLTINNNLQEKRFVGNYKKGSKSILPAQRMYEISLSGLVTDSLLFDQLLNEAENPSTSGQMIELTFTKENGENITLKFTDYFVSAANFPIPEDNSPFIVDAIIMPRTLNTCTVKTHWLLQG